MRRATSPCTWRPWRTWTSAPTKSRALSRYLTWIYFIHYCFQSNLKRMLHEIGNLRVAYRQWRTACTLSTLSPSPSSTRGSPHSFAPLSTQFRQTRSDRGSSKVSWATLNGRNPAFRNKQVPPIIQNVIHSHEGGWGRLQKSLCNMHAAIKVRHGAGNYCKTGFMYRPPTKSMGKDK